MSDHTIMPGVEIIFEAVHGSQAFGLDGPGSDIDIKGIVIGPADWYHGFSEAPEQLILNKDHTLYDIRKFFRLAIEANPTALEMLWAPETCIRVSTPAAEKLLAVREKFLSLRVADSFGKYALSQLRRIKTHRRWLLQPPTEQPQRRQFELPAKPLISGDQMGAADALLNSGKIASEEISPNFLLMLDRERSYRAAQKEWQQYEAWKRERNPARAALEEKFGYDTKHALHLVRLLRMALEILTSGEVIVRRPDREELLAVKQGAWKFDDLIDYAERTQQQVQQARAASPLPELPDKAELNLLCSEIIGECLNDRKRKA
jgi:predicted nucleotidyltransferase